MNEMCDCIYADKCFEAWREIPCSKSMPPRKWKALQKRMRKQITKQIQALNEECRKEGNK